MKTKTFLLSLAGFGIVLFLLLALVAIVDGTSRTLFNLPIQGTSDLVELLLPVAVSMLLPLAFFEEKQVRIRFLEWLFKLSPTRFFELFAHLITLAVLIVVCWQLYRNFVVVYENSQTTWLMAIPVAPTWGICAILMGIASTIQGLVLLNKLQKRDKQ